MADQAKRNKSDLLDQIDVMKTIVQDMSDECFEDYYLYLNWRPNIKENRIKSINFYSGTGAPTNPPPPI